VLLVCLFLVSLPAVTPRIYSSDEIQYFAYLRSLWFDRDLSFENEYRYFYDRGIGASQGFHETFLERQTETGRRINFGTIGCAILWTPFYAVGHAIARASLSENGAAPDGYSTPYLAAVAYGSAVYGFAAIVLSILSTRRLGLDAFIPALAIWFGTPLLFYMYLAPPFSHACSAFGVALFIYIWLRVREDWSAGGLAALGAAAALMAMIREQDAFFAIAAALDFGLAWTLGFGLWASGRDSAPSQRLKPKAQSLIAAFLAFAVTYAPQAIAYMVLNGHIGPHSSVGRKMTWTAPHAAEVLFSPEHGFFFWTPLAAVALAGLFLRRQRVFALLLIMVVLQVYVAGSVESWTVAGAFGQRRFIALTAILIVGLSALWHSARSRAARSVLAIVLALGVYWNVALTAEFAVGLMDRQKLEPRSNAYHAFVTLPRQMPGLAYRYLFDRSSFYKPR